MNKKKMIGAGAVLALLFSACGYELGQYQAHQAQENSVSYVDADKSGKNQKNQLASEKNPDDISKEEGISAEQIVVKITDKGYVTSHGDHYHYYNGKVPFNALISEELLMKDPNYVFKKSDVVNVVKDGYIIKVDGKYYLYLKEGSKKSNLRTKEQIAEQAAKGAKEAEKNRNESASGKGYKAAGHVGASAQEIKTAKSQGRYTTDDGYIFNPNDVIEDTGDAYIVPHGNHFHYIPKGELSASELGAAQAVWAAKSGKSSGHKGGSGNSSKPIPVSNAGSWTPAPTGGHQNAPIYYPSVPNTPVPAPRHTGGQGSKPNQPAPSPVVDKNHVSYQDLLHQLYKQPANKRHREGDGLVFDPNTVTKLTSRGYVIPHGDHWHVVPENQLSPLEIYLARMHLAGQTQVDKATAEKLLGLEGAKTPVTPTPVDHKPESPKEKDGKINLLDGKITKTKQGKDGKPYSTDDGYKFNIDSIKSYDEDGIIADHEGHEHYIPYSELEDSELKQVQDAINAKDSKIGKVDDGHFSKEEIAKKLQYLALQNGIKVEQLKVTGDKVIIPHGNHTHTAELKNIPSKLTPDQFEDLVEYETIIMQLKMGKAKQDYKTEDIIRSGSELIIYGKDGSTKHVPLNEIKLPLDYQEVDFSGAVAVKNPNDEKLDYISRQYKVPRTQFMVLGDIVSVPGKPSVSLNLVNINDPIIYTLRNDKPSVSVEDKDLPEDDVTEATDTDTSKPDAPTPSQPAEDVTEEAVEEEDPYEAHLQALANQYGLTVKDFQNRIMQLSFKYGVSMEHIQFGTYLTFNANGKSMTYDIINQTFVN
ncbi:pneumococcal-type histidine triad protein [Streptococcus penaeicida]|uniref:pneumococcal-type histidine triad protein n=1 Tax=Streptococcus penaeicida TaxID=1765960 RepID=UPI0039F05279